MNRSLRLLLSACLLTLLARPAAAQRLGAPIPASQVHEELIQQPGEPPTKLGQPTELPPPRMVAPEVHPTPAAILQGPPVEWVPPFDDPCVPVVQRFIDAAHAGGQWF